MVEDAQEMPPSFPPEDKAKPAAKPSVGTFVAELAFVIVAALVVSMLVKTFLVQAFHIPSPSMTHTLEVGDRIVVNKLADSPEDIHRGDVVVFVDPGGWLSPQPDTKNAFQKVLYTIGEATGIVPRHSGEHLVKRVIGTGGDHVTCCSVDGKIEVNGTEITETYIRDGANPSNYEFDVVVPEDHLWVMGDNRSNSEDSRAHMGVPGGGFVPVDNVEGRVWFIMYPISRFGGLTDASPVFANVPDPQ